MLPVKPGLVFSQPSAIGLDTDDAQSMLDRMVELLTSLQQPPSFDGIGNDPVARQAEPEDLHRGV